jgi:hypothetical protein
MKMLNIGDMNKIDFVSKNFHYTPNGYVIMTPIERMFTKMNVYVGDPVYH